MLGFALSLVIAFVPFPGAKIAARLIDTIIALPTFLVTLAFTFIYGSAGLLNDSLMQRLPPRAAAGRLPVFALGRHPRRGDGLHALRHAAAARHLLARSTRPRSRSASSLGARPFRIVRQIILPAALPALVAGGSLCLLLTVNEFGIVLFIGAKDVITLPLLIYDKAIQEFDYTTRLRHRGGQCRAVARPLQPLPARHRAFRRPPCWCGLGPAAWPSGLSSVPLFLVLYGLPIGIIALASVAGQWNGILPSSLTLAITPMRSAATRFDSLKVSVADRRHRQRGGARLRDLGGAGAARGRRRRRSGCSTSCSSFRVPCRRFRSASACWWRSAGRRCCSTARVSIVLIAHFVLISAFTYGNVSAGLARLPIDCEQVAESLGARPFYKLRRVTLPLLVPYLVAALSLSFALSMGELGATVMVYPPGWVTLPVRIFSLSDRGAIFDAATLTMILGATTLLVLVGLSRVSTRAMVR